jgi:seryl-tRNA synthetase
MLDRRWIVENQDAFKAGLSARLVVNAHEIAQGIADLDQQFRDTQTRLHLAQAHRKEIATRIGQAKRGDPAADTAGLMAEATTLKSEIENLERMARTVEESLHDGLLQIPNLPDSDVPKGGEENNAERFRFGEGAASGCHHYEFGPALGLDAETGVALAGSRFVLLRGPLARLERGLTALCLDTLAAIGFEEVSPPLMVRPEVMRGTGQLPKFEPDLFAVVDGEAVRQGWIEDRTQVHRWLIPTAEVPLTNTVANRILDASDLPIRLAAATPCFRAEAGSAGRDVRGMIRLHQFSKVEMVSIVEPFRSENELEMMLTAACMILQKLRIPHRVVLLAAGDMGFSAAKTYDIEVWLPGQQAYREIASISNCRDFQARRMDARYRPAAGAKPLPVHTLNGSGLAISRLLVAVLETFQQDDGSVVLPEALMPYLPDLVLRPRPAGP